MKNLFLLLMLVVITPVLTSCGGSKSKKTPEDDGLKVECHKVGGCPDDDLKVQCLKVGGCPDDGGGMTFSENTDSSKNLEAMGAKVEAMEVAEMEDKLINYGLSVDRAQTLGKLMNSYNKIKTKRALTSREKDVFTKELTGLSFDKASSVLVEQGYDALVEKASVVNGAHPEAIKELLNEVI